MSLGRLNFDDIVEADLNSLIATGAPEGIAIEYKRAAYGRSDADVKEFLKDASSFANAVGGHLVIGMDESGGIASTIIPITGINPDDEVLRLESLMRDGLEPRVSGIRTKAVPSAGGGFTIVIRIPRSWNPPHRVTARNTNRFYARNSAGAHEVSVEELRILFTVASTAHDRIRAFRRERIAKISAGDTPIRLATERGKLLLHIVPLSAFSGRAQIDLERANQLQERLRPIAAMGYSPRFNFDGFINIRGGNPCHGYTQIFRDGSIEAIKAHAVAELNGRLIIPSVKFGSDVFEILPLYLDALRSLDVPPPLAVMLTFDEIYGAVLGVSNARMAFDPPEPILRSVLELPEVIIEDYGSAEDYQRALRPAFDALWNAGGFSAAEGFDADGVWTGVVS